MPILFPPFHCRILLGLNVQFGDRTRKVVVGLRMSVSIGEFLASTGHFFHLCQSNRSVVTVGVEKSSATRYVGVTC